MSIEDIPRSTRTCRRIKVGLTTAEYELADLARHRDLTGTLSGWVRGVIQAELARRNLKGYPLSQIVGTDTSAHNHNPDNDLQLHDKSQSRQSQASGQDNS